MRRWRGVVGLGQQFVHLDVEHPRLHREHLEHGVVDRHLQHVPRGWIFAYLFAKKDRANIDDDDDELADFKKLAQAFGRMTDTELRAALNQGDLLELCDEE